MDDKERYRAEMEARILSNDETFNEIKTRMRRRKERLQSVELDGIAKKQEAAKAKVKAMETMDKSRWERAKRELEELVNDVDEETRRALAYLM